MTLVMDRDLLVIEPKVFIDAAGAGTALLQTTDAEVSGDALTSAADFQALGIQAGHVAVVDGTVVEVVQRTDATTLAVTLPRGSSSDPAIGPGDGTSLPLTIITFARLIALEQEALLCGLGIDPDHPLHPLDENAIVNPSSLARLIAVRTIRRAFAGASAANPASESLKAQAALYGREASAAAQRVMVLLDRDGDGAADDALRLDVVNLVRA